jgi:hypothetical protein
MLTAPKPVSWPASALPRIAGSPAGIPEPGTRYGVSDETVPPSTFAVEPIVTKPPA